MPRTPESAEAGKYSTRSASTSSFLDLSDREIAIRIKSLPLDELERLAPLLRILFCGVMECAENSRFDYLCNCNARIGRLDVCAAIKKTGRLTSACFASAGNKSPN